MKVLHDLDGLAIRLTDERRDHILEHPEMAEMEAAIEETLLEPERVVQSISDPEVHLYYRFYFRTVVGREVSLRSREDERRRRVRTDGLSD